MNKFNKIFFGLACLIFVFSASTQVLAAGNDCRCFTRLDLVMPEDLYKDSLKKKPQVLNSICIVAKDGECNPKSQEKILGITKDTLYPDCAKSPDPNSVENCIANTKDWVKEKEKMLVNGKVIVESASGGEKKEPEAGGSVLSALIKRCGAAAMDQDCFDITVFISLLIQLTDYLFGIIGALALGSFIYGGFVLILSQGNPEKVKQGTGAMINALIGLLIAFGGYVLVSFLSEILKLKSNFSLK